MEFKKLSNEEVVLVERVVGLRSFKGKIVRHFKGNLYLVIDVGYNTNNCNEIVIYKALYKDCKIWVRPIEEFLSKVPEGKDNPTGQKYRFEFVEKDSRSEFEEGD